VAVVRKFDFETEFAPDGEILRDSNAPPKHFLRAEVDAECASAYEKGKKDALAQAERDVAAALRDLARACEQVLQRLDDESRAMRGEAGRIALAAARKIAGDALEGFGHERAMRAVEAAMDALRHQPRLIVKLSPAIADIVKPRVDAMREAHAYSSAILVRADAAMKPGEVIIDWSDGVISLDPRVAEERVESLIAAAMTAADHPT